MSLHTHETVNETDAVRRGYEESRVKPGVLFALGGAVVLLVVVGVLGGYAVFRFFVSHQSLGPPATPFETARELPPGPRLQTYAPLDLKRYRDGQNGILDSYGWVDPKAGIVRIPISRAMDLLLREGYPVRGSSPVNGQANTPGEAPPPGPLITPRQGNGVEAQ